MDWRDTLATNLIAAAAMEIATRSRKAEEAAAHARSISPEHLRDSPRSRAPRPMAGGWRGRR